MALDLLERLNALATHSARSALRSITPFASSPTIIFPSTNDRVGEHSGSGQAALDRELRGCAHDDASLVVAILPTYFGSMTRATTSFLVYVSVAISMDFAALMQKTGLPDLWRPEP